MEFSTWLAFFAASWAISLSPGPGAVAAMSAGFTHGFRRGVTTVFGLILGIWTQLIVVGFGLGALVKTSSTLFSALKWLGVAYLVWIGIQQWRSPAKPLLPDAEASAPDVTIKQLIGRAWAINAVNPKGTVFLLAVVPQFLDPMAPLFQQYVVIGLTLSLTDLVVMGGYTALAASVLRRLKSVAVMKFLNRFFGSLFILAGALLATWRR